MQYKSPLRFFEYSHIDVSDIDQVNIARAKKQIAAEFSMEPSGIINLEGIDYNKQEIFSLIESAQFTSDMQQHKKIWEHKSLLKFLESGTIANGLSEDVAALKEELSFVHFCSPYFAPQFNKEMKRRLSGDDFDSAADWITNCEMILISDGEVAFNSSTTYLEEAIKLFRNLNKTTFVSRIQEVMVWTRDWSRFLNWLPDNLYGVKDELATVLINFCVEIQNADERTCYLISRQMVLLDYLDPTNARLVRENHAIYEEKIADTDLYPGGRRRRPHKKNNKELNYIWYILVAIVILVRIMGNGCNNSSSYNDKTVNFYDASKTKDLITKLFFEKARKIGSQGGRSGMSQNWADTVQSLPIYLSMFQSEQAAEEATLELINRTNKPLYVYLNSGGEITYLDLESSKKVRIRTGGTFATDFILSAEEDLKLATNDSIECFFINGKGLKNINRQYSDTAGINLEDAKYKHLIRVVIEKPKDTYIIGTLDEAKVYRTITGL